MDRVCQFYLRGRCNRNNCEFKHVKPVEDAANASIYRKTPCRFFEANGSCRFGDNCRFFHDAASNKKYNASKTTPIVDSDDDIPRGLDSDDDSIVSGFTEYASIVAKKSKRGLADKQDEAKSFKTQKISNKDQEKEESMELRKGISSVNKEKELKKPIVQSPSLDERFKNFDSKILPTARKSSVSENSPSILKNINVSVSDKSNSSIESLMKADNEPLKRAPLMVAKKSVPQIFDNNRSGTAKESKIKKNVSESNKKFPTKEVTMKNPLSGNLHESITTMDNSKLDKQSEIETVETIESFIKVNETPVLMTIENANEMQTNKSGAEWENLMSGEECITSIDSASTDIMMEEKQKEVPPLILRKNTFSNTRGDKKGVIRSKSDESSKSKNNLVKSVSTKAAESGTVYNKDNKDDDGDDEEDENMDESSDWISSIEESFSDEKSDSSISGRTKIRIKKLTATKINNTILKNSVNLKALQQIKCDTCQRRKGIKKKSCVKCMKLQKVHVDESTPKPAKRPRGRPKLNKSVSVKTTKVADPVKIDKHPIEEKSISSPEKKEEEKKMEEDSPSICKPQIMDKPKQVSEDLELPKFDPNKFKPGYTPSIVKKGDAEYAVVVTGVKDTGLCGKYWGDLNNLPSRRRSKINNQNETQKKVEDTPPKGRRSHSKKDSSPSKKTSEPKTPVGSKRKLSDSSPSMKSANEKSKTESPKASNSKTHVTTKSPTNVKKSVNGSEEKKIPSQPLLKRINKGSPSKPTEGYETTSPTTTNSHSESASETPSISSEYFSSPSALSNMSMQKERFAPYDDNRWVSIGKDLMNNSFDAVQYTRALRLPFHLLSFLRIKGNSVKGMSCTDKNNMVFVVIEGEITVALQGSTSHFDCKKGDSFYIPPKNNYNLMNNKAREAELCIFQFANEGVIPPNSASVSSDSVKSPTHQSK